jgi:hypothetical protein
VVWETPFLYQVKVGPEPLLIPVAVNVTLVPAQTEAALEAMLTAADTLLVTVKATKLDAAVEVDKQVGKVPPAATFAETTSPLAGE